MLDPFVDTTQKELREAWKKIEELEQENKRLKKYIDELERVYGFECDKGDVINDTTETY